MFVLGLTGTIGAGKSSVLAMFAAAGVAAASADAMVHALYRGRAVGAVGEAFPGTVAAGAVDRQALAARVAGDPAALARLEAIVHPLVREEQAAFLQAAAAAGRRFAVVEVPLLVETGAQSRFDAIATVSAREDVRLARVMARPGMTAEKFEGLVARQASDAEKRLAAHFVIDNNGTLDDLRRQTLAVVRALAPVVSG